MSPRCSRCGCEGKEQTLRLEIEKLKRELKMANIPMNDIAVMKVADKQKYTGKLSRMGFPGATLLEYAEFEAHNGLGTRLRIKYKLPNGDIKYTDMNLDEWNEQ